MLVQQTIRNQVLDLIDSVDNDNISRDDAREVFANKLTEIIINAIKSARVTLPVGSVRVVGSQTNQQNIIPLIIDPALS